MLSFSTKEMGTLNKVYFLCPLARILLALLDVNTFLAERETIVCKISSNHHRKS